MNGNPEENSNRHGIISACSWTVDRIKIIDVWPQQEHLAEISATDMHGGGCGYNLGVDIRKLDNTIPVEAIGLLGDDADGTFLLNQVTDAGIDTTQLIQNKNSRTSFTDVYSVADTGKRTFFHHPGSNNLITPDNFDFILCKGKILHLGLLGVHALMDGPWQQDTNGWVAVLKSAQRHGIHTNLELVSIAQCRIRDIALPCVAHTNSLIVNEYELGALTDSPICKNNDHIDQDLFTRAANILFEHSTRHNGNLSLVVAHSPHEAMAITADGSAQSQPCHFVDPAQIISSVGAGDAFAAGMLYGIHEHWPLEQSLELAHAAAAASLRSTTTTGSVASVENCLQLARTTTSESTRHPVH